MRLIPYINLDGNAAEAVEFYTKVFGATNKGVMRFGDNPSPGHPVPPEAASRVMHAEIEVDGNSIYISDTFPGTPYTVGNQLTIAVMFQEEPRVKSVYGGLTNGGHVLMELQKTFWSPAFGMVRDKYGIIWQLSLEATH